jgi:hypothetical protein
MGMGDSAIVVVMSTFVATLSMEAFPSMHVMPRITFPVRLASDIASKIA